MSIKKRILSLFLTAAIAVTGALGFSGCADVSVAMTIDGVEIPAGLYILYSGYAYSAAITQLTEEQPDLDTSAEGFNYYDQTVSEMNFADYVKQETVNFCKRYVVTERLYDELGLSMSAEEIADTSDSINTTWAADVSSYATYLTYLNDSKTIGSYFEKYGISKASYRLFYESSLKNEAIFQAYYGEEGSEPVSAAEISDYIVENYTLARYIAVSLNDADGELIEETTQLAALEALAQGYVDRLAEGENFADVYASYEDYVAEQEAANEDESDETEEAEETTAAETDIPDEDSAEADEPSETEAADETTAPEEDAADPEEEEKPVDSDYDRIIAKTSTSPSEDFVKTLFEMDFNAPAIYKADTYYYVVVRYDIRENSEYVEDYTQTALNGLKGDEFEDMLEGRYADYATTTNKSAPDYTENAQSVLQGVNTPSNMAYIDQQLSYYSGMFG